MEEEKGRGIKIREIKYIFWKRKIGRGWEGLRKGKSGEKKIEVEEEIERSGGEKGRMLGKREWKRMEEDWKVWVKKWLGIECMRKGLERLKEKLVKNNK